MAPIAALFLVMVLEQVAPAQDLNLSRLCLSNRAVQQVEELAKVDEPSGLCSQNDHGNVDRSDVLLVWQVLIYREKNIELCCGEREKRTVFGVLPPQPA
ncbi:MAG: hypothetical protein JWO56_748 [Acidobacteria bacterium]|nr:hypothetical protein [Acidobacteriota bacterium]